MLLDQDIRLYQINRCVKLASDLNIVVRPLDLDQHGVGVRVLSTDRCHVDVLLMLFNWRICETDLSEWTYGRSWCIEGRSDDSFCRAVIEAARYAGDPGDEPRGFVKSWDGRRGR